MKPILLFLLFVLSLSSLTGCGVEVSRELAAIDSLISEKPDSALGRLQAIDPADLSAKNEAYYALLITMARYKCYKPIESDSVIDIAVRYYDSNPQEYRLTKALMYKGAVLADMGLSKEALDCYKQAETLADTTDYLTMGWINTRMGELYSDAYIDNQEDIERYKNALHYYGKVNEPRYINHVCHMLGRLYTLPNRDSAYYYINKSIELSKIRKDSAQMFYDLNVLARIDQHYNNNQAVLNICSSVPSSFRQNRDYCKLIITAYAKLGKVDSAEMHLRCIEPKTAKQRVSYLMALENIAVAKGQYQDAHKYGAQAYELADSISKAARKDDLYRADKRFDNQVIKAKALVLEQKNALQKYILAFSGITMLALVIILYLIVRNKRQKLAQNELIMLQLQQESQNSLDNLQQLLESKHNDETKLKELLGNRMAMLRKIMELRYHYGDNANVFISKLNTFIAQNRQTNEVCETVIDIANMLGDNVISRIRERYPHLTDNDLLLLSLISLHFSVAETCVYMGYANHSVVSSSRNRLARKIGINVPLDRFVETMKG